ncbi:hypothetical protein L6654_04460 [Bradyrhizobium sp. WYCCWR 13023]|uniref:Uncharacterized protein n=1 Tax=Bradyrhizobium zhengyangense TaxID=2911009 RepID=A0A9X1R5P5_9BRAD|nr:hypothetical protein [Bradyrhizobium zhengyangense]MCG2625871.1 hypothetical protein [Bradyrhizobium zhengyangense]MCG2638484.1 hypothetical protein [Bradyrhizobium zhengyangense]MCG2666884.1 hypothetical protein [Bradyrhizobium zhengyangense]
MLSIQGEDPEARYLKCELQTFLPVDFAQGPLFDLSVQHDDECERMFRSSILDDFLQMLDRSDAGRSLDKMSVRRRIAQPGDPICP